MSGSHSSYQVALSRRANASNDSRTVSTFSCDIALALRLLGGPLPPCHPLGEALARPLVAFRCLRGAFRIGPVRGIGELILDPLEGGLGRLDLALQLGERGLRVL